MKKFYMTIVAMLCGVAAMAQTNELYGPEEIAVAKGTTEVDLEISMRNDAEVTAISFRLGFPEGISMALNKKGKKWVTIDEDRMEDHTAIIQTADDGADMISVYDANVAPFYENDGVVVTVPLAITDDAAAVDCTYPIKVYSISISNTAGVSVGTSEEFTVDLKVGEGTGINSINAADSKAPVYNIAGQRVSKAQKGVYIQGGKKVAVK